MRVNLIRMGKKCEILTTKSILNRKSECMISIDFSGNVSVKVLNYYIY